MNISAKLNICAPKSATSQSPETLCDILSKLAVKKNFRMKYNIELETKLIKKFFVKEKQNRLIEFIQTEKKRKKFIDELNKNNLLQTELFEEIKGNEYDEIESKIRKIKNLKNCYVISEISNLDGETLEIKDALTQIIGSDSESIIVFGDCEIVYIEKEGFSNRFISI